ncbi:MAG TPA: hypothetical protein V6C46_09550 [Coleofasciculaceae cyanobacterium]
MPKKTIEQIINSDNDYLISVKRNQPTLFEYLNQQFEQTSGQSVDIEFEKTRDRETQRTVSVLDRVDGIDPAWRGVQRMVRVERSGTRAGKPYTVQR